MVITRMEKKKIFFKRLSKFFFQDFKRKSYSKNITSLT